MRRIHAGNGTQSWVPPPPRPGPPEQCDHARLLPAAISTIPVRIGPGRPARAAPTSPGSGSPLDPLSWSGPSGLGRDTTGPLFARGSASRIRRSGRPRVGVGAVRSGHLAAGVGISGWFGDRQDVRRILRRPVCHRAPGTLFVGGVRSHPVVTRAGRRNGRVGRSVSDRGQPAPSTPVDRPRGRGRVRFGPAGPDPFPRLWIWALCLAAVALGLESQGEGR